MWGLGFLFLRQPSAGAVQNILQDGQRHGFNHLLVGSSEEDPYVRQELRQGWTIDHSRIQVGTGQRSYKRAMQALQGWQHFQLPWAAVVNLPEVKAGSPVGVVARSLFVWTCNPLQVVYAKEQKRDKQLPKYEAPDSGGRVRIRRQPRRTTSGRTFRFAHSTLAGHQLAGEERFAVEWHKDDDSVWYEIYTFSRPATPLALVTYPLVRLYQRRFARDSMNAMAQLLQRSQ